MPRLLRLEVPPAAKLLPSTTAPWGASVKGSKASALPKIEPVAETVPPAEVEVTRPRRGAGSVPIPLDVPSIAAEVPPPPKAPKRAVPSDVVPEQEAPAVPTRARRSASAARTPAAPASLGAPRPRSGRRPVWDDASDASSLQPDGQDAADAATEVSDDEAAATVPPPRKRARTVRLSYPKPTSPH